MWPCCICCCAPGCCIHPCGEPERATWIVCERGAYGRCKHVGFIRDVPHSTDETGATDITWTVCEGGGTRQE